MKWMLLAAMGLFLPVVSAQAEHFYVDSEGYKLELELAPDRVALTPVPGAERALLERRELFASPQPATHQDGMWEMELQPDLRGQQQEVLQSLIQEGLVENAGLVFQVPGYDLHFALGRQVMVKMGDVDALNHVLAVSGLELVDYLDREGFLFLCQAANAEAALRSSVTAAGLAGVEWALPDFSIPIELYQRPTDPYYGEQWYHYQDSGAHISAEAAWDLTKGDKQVVVAVIDTGFDESHPDFEADRLVTGYNAVTGENDPTPLATAVDAHGTCCGGVIAATADNGEGIAGVCPGCSLMGIKMMDGMADNTQISTGYRALEYATANGAWVLSNSWGIDENLMRQIDIEPYYEAIIDAAKNGRDGKGAVVLFASGNGNQWTLQAEPIGEKELANMPEVMTVGGTGPTDTIVAYSDYGPNLAVVAPTGSINMTDLFDGPQILTTDTTGDAGFSRNGTYWTMGFGGDMDTELVELDTTGNYTSYFNGTSAACPVVAGVVGLVFSANPELTGNEARLIVTFTADKVGGDVYDASGFNDKYGYGRVNAARAVRAAVFGIGQPDGAACAEDINCESQICYLPSSAADEGSCVTPCKSTDDCEDAERCADVGDVNICLPTCVDDRDCTPPQLCLVDAEGNLCEAIACSDGLECPDQTACPLGGGYCSRPCESDADCVLPALCLAGGGGDLCQEIACASDTDCPVGSECGAGGICARPGEDTSGGGGSSCASSPAAPSGWVSLLLLAGFWIGRRRKR